MKARFLLIGVLVSFLGAHSVQTASEELSGPNKGFELLRQGKIDEAISQLLKGMAENPKDPDIRLGLAYAYDRQGSLEGAIVQYQKAIELNPRDPTAFNNLGVLYEKKGNYDEAIRHFEKAVNIDPQSAIGAKNLETAKKNQSTLQERERKVAEAIKKVESNPDDPKAHYSLARVYAFSGKKELAISSLGKAIELGYSDIGYVKTDTALDSIRNEPDYVWLLRGK